MGGGATLTRAVRLDNLRNVRADRALLTGLRYFILDAPLKDKDFGHFI